MEKLDIDFSEKNIPSCSLFSYKRSLLAEIDRFKDAIRWRVFHFKKPKSKNNKETYGLKSKNKAPADVDLVEFERRMYELVKETKFEQTKKSNIDKRKQQILNLIKSKNMIVVKSDKTNNSYLISPDEYFQLMERELNKDYKIDSENAVENMINENAN